MAFLVMSDNTYTEFNDGFGWTLYPPLATSEMNFTITIIVYSLIVAGMSSLLASINFVLTMGNMRSSGLIFQLLALFNWSLIITAGMLVVVLPIIAGSLMMLFTDLHYNTSLFDPSYGGDAILYQHYFWLFGHPEVYILIIPAFGIISQTIAIISQKLIFCILSMVLAIGCIAIFGVIVWGHHIYTIGFEADTRF